MKLTRPKSYVDVAVAFFAVIGLLGMCSLALYGYILQHKANVDAQGTLHEPYFFMLVFGHAMIWIGLAAVNLLLFSRFVWRMIVRLKTS